MKNTLKHQAPFFHFRQNGETQQEELFCEEIPVSTLTKKHGTPLFIYSEAAIENAFRKTEEALSFAPHMIAYAVKANSNLAILRLLGELGAGMDIVSGGELMRALKAGVTADKIVFSGVGKTDQEIELALSKKIRAIHAESAEEILVISKIAKRMGVKAPVSLRVNPDVDPQTHPYISTGLHQSKFGLEISHARTIIPEILDDPNLSLHGLACHIGSQLSSAQPLEDAVRILGSFAVECTNMGAKLKALDAGGGWPIAYGNETKELPRADSYGKAIETGLRESGADKLGVELTIEPGRSMVGNSGILVTQVIFVKERDKKKFVIVDAAMTEILRPSLYSAYHAISPTSISEQTPQQTEMHKADIVGPVCETGDFLALDREMPPIERGETLALGSAGAYCMSMASNYNSRRRPAEVLVDGESSTLIRKRDTLESLWEEELA